MSDVTATVMVKDLLLSLVMVSVHSVALEVATTKLMFIERGVKINGA